MTMEGDCLPRRQHSGRNEEQAAEKPWSIGAGRVLVLCFCITAFCLQWPTACAVEEQRSLPWSFAPATTLSPDIFPNITLSPSTGVNYTLCLSTSGPAVIDSVITFMADLNISPPFNDSKEHKFRYKWLNMADGKYAATMDGNHSEYKRPFYRSDDIDPGEYLMMVIVEPSGKPGEILTFSSIHFKITERLNGHVNVSQQLPYQRRNNTFATREPVTLHVNVTDQFRRKDSPDFTFYWYNHTDANESQLIERTDKPVLKHTFSQAGILILDAETVAQFQTDRDRDSDDISEKHGLFKRHLIFKDKLAECNSSRIDADSTDQSVKMGSPVTLNITCTHGSFPTAVCWNITGVNATLNTTCRPQEFYNKTEQIVSVSLSQTGWQTVHLAIYNDVSFQTFVHDFYVYDADSVNIPALVFPIVFIVIGIVIAVAGGAYLVRLRKTMHVEVADFDFHPSISVRRPHIFSTVAHAVKGLYHRIRHQTRNRNEYDRRYPARPAHVQRSMSLYESL